jgi:hypothetical protein
MKQSNSDKSSKTSDTRTIPNVRDQPEVLMPSINGTWNSPSQNRCDKKAAYPSMMMAETKAAKATIKMGRLIIAYQFFDCGGFHIGHADRSQIMAHLEQAEAPPICVLCGSVIPKHLGRFIPNSQGYVCGTRRCSLRTRLIPGLRSVERCC